MLHIDNLEFYVSCGLLVATWVGVCITYRSMVNQNKTAQDIANTARFTSRIDMEYKLENEFTGNTRKIQRKELAQKLINKSPHDDIHDDVMDFFDMVGTLLRRNALDEELVYTGFGFYIIKWWDETKNYILKERNNQGNDITLYEDFEELYNKMILFEMKKRGISREEIELETNDKFLIGENNLSII